MDNIVTHPTDGRSSDSHLLADGVIACVWGPSGPHGSADVNVTAAAVRRADPTLSGGKVVMDASEDTPAADLAWVAVGTLCRDGVS